MAGRTQSGVRMLPSEIEFLLSATRIQFTTFNIKLNYMLFKCVQHCKVNVINFTSTFSDCRRLWFADLIQYRFPINGSNPPWTPSHHLQWGDGFLSHCSRAVRLHAASSKASGHSSAMNAQLLRRMSSVFQARRCARVCPFPRRYFSRHLHTKHGALNGRRLYPPLPREIFPFRFSQLPFFCFYVK